MRRLSPAQGSFYRTVTSTRQYNLCPERQLQQFHWMSIAFQMSKGRSRHTTPTVQDSHRSVQARPSSRPQLRHSCGHLQTQVQGTRSEALGQQTPHSAQCLSLGPHMFLEPTVKGKMVLGWAQPFPLWETPSRSINERQGGEERRSQGQGQNVWAAREKIKLWS